MRQPQSLAGIWQFQVDPDGSLTHDTLSLDRAIPVPLPWQAAFPDLQQYSGYGWYQTDFEVPAAALNGELLLHFGAVDYWCQVFVNGTLAGEHEGGYMPITLPIRRFVQPGANRLIVRVYDSAQTQIDIPRWPSYPPTTSREGPPFDANHVPHGKQEWYINVGGIWQDVTLTAVAATYIDHVQITPDIHTGAARIVVELAGDRAALAGGHLDLAVQDGQREVTITVLLVAGRTIYEATLTVSEVHCWSPEDPHLYSATVGLVSPAGEDRLTQRFGYREIRTRDGQILLNGEPLFLLCALDQDLYPETIYTVPSVDYLRDEFLKAKALGLNTLRCHIKPPDPRYLDLADEMGLLVWSEIPSWRTFYPKGTVHPNLLNLDERIRQRAEQLLEAMIRRDYNHPAIIIWTLVNEDWGTALPLSSADRAWVRELYHRCKALDPTRLVVDNSPCPHSWGPNIHVESDLDDFHIYANIPDQARNFENSIRQFAMRPIWTYSSHGDTHRTGREPLVLSEFGNWGLPELDSLRDPAGHDPAWFQIGPWWSPWDGEAGWPAGVEERFHALGLDQIWPDYAAFARASQWHQFHAFKFEIEVMRSQPGLQGYVITELTDAYWESNGLLDFARRPKIYFERFSEINTPDVVIARPEAYTCWAKEVLKVAITAAHYSAADWTDARLTWQLGETGRPESLPVAALGRGQVQMLGSLALTLPPVDAAATVGLYLRLENGQGQELARNQIDIQVLPAGAQHARLTTPLVVVAREDLPTGFSEMLSESMPGGSAPDVQGVLPMPLDDPGTPEDEPVSELATKLRALGYRTTHRLPAGPGTAVSNSATPALLEWVRAGGDLLFLGRGPSPFFWVQGRGGTYGGSWLTSFSWLRPATHPRLAVENPLSLPYTNIMAEGVILGLPVEDPAVQGDFLAGQISGWINHPAIHTVQFRYGRGRVIMTTLALENTLGRDAATTAVFHDLLEHLASADCQPVLTANYGSPA